MTWHGTVLEQVAEDLAHQRAQRRSRGREHCRAAPMADRPLPSQKQVAASTASAKPSNSKKPEPFLTVVHPRVKELLLVDLERRDRLFREWVRFLGLLPAPAKP